MERGAKLESPRITVLFVERIQVTYRRSERNFRKEYRNFKTIVRLCAYVRFLRSYNRGYRDSGPAPG